MNVPMPYMPPTYRRLGCPGVPPPRVPEPLQWPLPLLLEKFAEYRDQLVQEVADLVRAETGIVASVNGYTGAVTLAKSDVGLGNVANTGDSDTPAENGAEKFTTGGAFAALARKADKSEMSVTPGTGADADKTTIQLKDGTSATVLVSHQSLASYVNGGSYDSTGKKILLKHGSTTLAEIDATAFIKDGMVSSVAIVNVPSDETPAGLSNGDYLKVTFNTDAGADPIYIPLADIFDPSNYYTKAAAEATFVAQVSGKGLSTNDYTTAEKEKLSGVAAGAQVNVIETVRVNGTALTPAGKAVDITTLTQAQAVSASVAEVTAVVREWQWPETFTYNGNVYHYVQSDAEMTDESLRYYLTHMATPEYIQEASMWFTDVYLFEHVEYPSGGGGWVIVLESALRDYSSGADATTLNLSSTDFGISLTLTSVVHNKHGLARLVDLPAASTATPQMDGVPSAGASAAFARGDHVHPKDTSKQDVISDLAAIRSGAAAGATAYQKPSGGIPASDMASAVQTSLGKADTAVQPAALRYDLVQTITLGQLQDRAVQKVELNAASTTLVLPALTDLSGKVSDFGIDMVNAYEVSGTPTAATFQLDGTLGTDYNLIVPKGETWSDMTALAAGEMAQFYFTLSAFAINDKPTWKVVKQVVELVPVPTAP